MELEKGVQEEIEKFRAVLPCKKERFCLPLYIITKKIRMYKHSKNQATELLETAVSLYNKIDDKRKKLFFDEIYKIIYEDMVTILYPEEKGIKHECDNPDCPSYSAIRIMDKGREFNEFLTSQFAAVCVFKHKESERLKYDIGTEKAWDLWINEKIITGGRETTRAKEFRNDYNKEKEKEIGEFGKNHKVPENHSIGEIRDKIIGKI